MYCISGKKCNLHDLQDYINQAQEQSNWDTCSPQGTLQLPSSVSLLHHPPPLCKQVPFLHLHHMKGWKLVPDWIATSFAVLWPDAICKSSPDPWILMGLSSSCVTSLCSFSSLSSFSSPRDMAIALDSISSSSSSSRSVPGSLLPSAGKWEN